MRKELIKKKKCSEKDSKWNTIFTGKYNKSPEQKHYHNCLFLLKLLQRREEKNYEGKEGCKQKELKLLLIWQQQQQNIKSQVLSRQYFWGVFRAKSGMREEDSTKKQRSRAASNSVMEQTATFWFWRRRLKS